MSLERLFVYCRDKQWYRNPVWFGQINDIKWFLCFDEDDDIEIVHQFTSGRPTPDFNNQVLMSLDIIEYHLLNNCSICERRFPHDDKFSKAKCEFFTTNQLFPKPHRPEHSTLVNNLSGTLYYYLNYIQDQA